MPQRKREVERSSGRAGPRRLAVEDIAADILMDDEDGGSAGGLRAALDDYLGYDTSRAEKLLVEARDRDDRHPDEVNISIDLDPSEIAEIVGDEPELTPEQLRRLALREKLMADHRGPVARAADFAWQWRPTQWRRQWRRFENYKGPIRPPLVVAAAAMLLLMLGVNGLLIGEASAARAPSHYPIVFSPCGHKAQLDRDSFEKLSFLSVHPDRYDVIYAGQPKPALPACPDCRTLHKSLRLVVCPACSQRFLAAHTDVDPPALTPEEIAALCPEGH